MSITDTNSHYGTLLSKFKNIRLGLADDEERNCQLILHNIALKIEYRKKVVIKNKSSDAYYPDESIVFNEDERNINKIESRLDGQFDNVNIRVTAVEPKAKIVRRANIPKINQKVTADEEGDCSED